MDFLQACAALNKVKRGTFTPICYERKLDTLKAYSGMNITKRTTATVRLGIDYDKMKSTIVKRATGELPPVNQGLIGREWMYFPYLEKGKKGAMLRVYPSKKNPTKTQYFVNGVPTPKEAVAAYCTAKEFPKVRREAPPTYSVCVDDIISIGK